MNLLNIDLKGLLPHIIDAFTEVYGEEYHSIILKKVNKSIIISYQDIESINHYILFLKGCKAREYSIKFLEKIGIEVEKYKKDSYINFLDIAVEDILKCFIYSSDAWCETDKEFIDFRLPIYAFDPNNDNSPQRLLRNKLKLINYFRAGKIEITEKNFELFSKTHEYSKILDKVNEYKRIYEELLNEYKDWEKSLLLSQEYVNNEKERKNKILKKKKDELFMEIIDKLPLSIKEKISNETLEEQQSKIFGPNDIGSQLLIESFSEENMKELKSDEYDINDVFWTVFKQDVFLSRLGIKIPDKDILDCDSKEDVEKYLQFLNQDDVKKFLPPYDLIDYITTLREKKYEEALKEYYMTRKDFRDALAIFNNNPDMYEYIYSRIKNKEICVSRFMNDKLEFLSIMFFTIRDNSSLAHSYVHEVGHIIDNSFHGCGFEHVDSYKIESDRNIYDRKFRKYEKFNETLNDIFSIEALEILRKKEIYLIEPKEFTLLDVSDCNTCQLVKNLLKPLLKKFRKQVIKAKITANSRELTKCIGEENFEELVDSINKVDFLSRNGLQYKLENKYDPMVKEYYRQLERVKKIYINIDNYYSKNSEYNYYGVEIKKS